MQPNKTWMLAVTALVGCAANSPGPVPVGRDENGLARERAMREPHAFAPAAPAWVPEPARTAAPRAADPVVAAPRTVDPDLAAVDTNLARLRALDVFEVGSLVALVPAENAAPYACGEPELCAQSAARIAARRLARFADAAEQAALHPVATPEAERPETVEANLAALRALHVVELPSLVTNSPAEHHFCYGVCPDEEAGHKRRAAALASIAARVRGGL